MQIFILMLVAINILFFFLFWRQKQKLQLMELLLSATIKTLESSVDGTKEIIDGRWNEEIKNGEGAELMHKVLLYKAHYEVSWDPEYALGYEEILTLFKKGKKLFRKNKTLSTIFSELTSKYEQFDF